MQSIFMKIQKSNVQIYDVERDRSARKSTQPGYVEVPSRKLKTATIFLLIDDDVSSSKYWLLVTAWIDFSPGNEFIRYAQNKRKKH